MTRGKLSLISAVALGMATVPMTLAACGAADSLAPEPEAQAAVDLNATGNIDVELRDAEGRTYPARIYFNDEAKGVAERLANRATILTEAPFELTDGFVRERPAVAAEPVDGSWMYVVAGAAADGTEPVGWEASYSAISEDDVDQVDSESGAVVDGEGPMLSAFGSYSFAVTLSSPNENDGFITCVNGAKAVQSCNWPSSGTATMRLQTIAGSTVTTVDSQSYTQFSCSNTSLDNFGVNATYRVRNSLHTSGGGAMYGSGSTACFFGF